MYLISFLIISVCLHFVMNNGNIFVDSDRQASRVNNHPVHIILSKDDIYTLPNLEDIQQYKAGSSLHSLLLSTLHI